MGQQKEYTTQSKPYLQILLALLFLSLAIQSIQVENDAGDSMKTSQQSQIKIEQIQAIPQELNEVDFQKFMQMNDRAIVYFYDIDCEYCTEFDQTFAQIQKIHDQKEPEKQRKISFAKIKLTETSEKVFRDLNIETVPQIKYFSRGKASGYAYMFNEYSRRSAKKHLEWVERVSRVEEFELKMGETHSLSIFGHSKELRQSKYIGQIESLQALSEKLKERPRRAFLLNCSYQEKESENRELGKFLKMVFLEHLDDDFYCTNNFSLLHSNSEIGTRGNEVFMNVYGLDREFEKAEFRHKILLETSVVGQTQSGGDQSESSKDYSPLDLFQLYTSNFMSYMGQELQYWSQSAVISVFSKNLSGFVFIMNNETKSKTAYTHYKQIKEKLHLHSHAHIPNFYYTDLSVTPQQTTRVKKHIFGIQISAKPTYPYPALAYLKPTPKYLRKYVFPLEQPLTPASIEAWIFKVLQQVQNLPHIYPPQSQAFKNLQSNPLYQSLTVKQHWRTTPEELFPTKYLNLFHSIYYNHTYTNSQKLTKLKIPDKFTKNKRSLKPINYNDFQVLLSSLFTEPIFVFVNSRTDFKSYELYTEIIQWIEEDQDDEASEEEDQEQIEQENPAKDNPSKVHDKQMSENKQEKENAQIQIKEQALVKKDDKAVQIKHELNEQNEPERILEQIKKESMSVSLHQGTKYAEQISMQKVLKDEGKQDKRLGTKIGLSEEEVFKIINLYLLNFNNNDYPQSYQDSKGQVRNISIEYFPALLYFSSDKTKMIKLEGVQTIGQIKDFVVNHLSEINDSEPKKVGIQIEDSDRELEGQFQSNIENSES